MQKSSTETPKFIFVSNYLNHHQIPFCNAMYTILQESFAFIQTEKMEKERVKMGWQEADQLPYERNFYEEPDLCRKWISDCQVVFFGGTDDESYIQKRLQEKKTVIRYSERLYKTGQWKAISPRGLVKKYQDHTRYRKDNVFLLCSGAYVPSDFHIVHAYPGKMLRWGYFPETREYEEEALMAGKRQRTILWAARFLDWKHPELALETAAWLRDRGYDFHMDMIGGGELEPMVRALLAEYQLEEVVTLQGYRTPDEVRGFMEQADIFLVTSDRQEGWGAVVNEAMNSGCAVVADHMVGAVPYLLKHGYSGLVYRDGKKEELFALTAKLLEDHEMCRVLGRNAMQTIRKEWNAENAAMRLAELCVRQQFLSREDVILKNDKDWRKAPLSGPCSPAPVISESRMYEEMRK